MMIWRRVRLRKSKHTFYVQQLYFFSDRAVSDDVKCGTAGQATDDNTARRRRDVICMPDN